MKKQLLALSMVAASGLMAQTDGSMQKQSYNQSNCCSDCCCTPCCCNNPRPCIDCECYVPAFHNLQCDWGFFLDVEFLYWYASENNIPYAARVEVVDTGDEVTTTPAEFICITDPLTLDAEWDPGVRAGLGWNMGCDGWDLYLNWTYFKNTSSRSSSTSAFVGDIPQILGEQAIFSNYTSFLANVFPFYSSLSASWVNRFNQIDLVVGKKYWLSRCFALRSFAGLRGAWTRTNLSIAATDGPKDPDAVVTQSDINFRDRSWGVGFIGGIEPTYYFTNCFALYANAGVSAIWGKFSERRSESLFQEDTNGVLRNILCPFSYDIPTMFTIIDTGIGLRWEQTWCAERFRTAFDLGWEHHMWNSHSFRFNGLTSLILAFTKYDYDVSDLGYGGLVVRLKWDF